MCEITPSAPPDALVTYTFARLFRGLNRCADIIGHANVESPHKIYNLLESMVQSGLFSRECILALDLSSILSKAQKYKVSKSDDVGSRAEA